MTNYKVRRAQLGDGKAIRQLLVAEGAYLLSELDWQNVYAGWLVVVCNSGDLNLIVAAIQYHPGWPVGRIERLVIAPQVQGRDKAIIVRDLCECARATLYAMGSQLVDLCIADHFPKWKQVLKNRGAVENYHGTSYLMHAHYTGSLGRNNTP